jgi:hypothetical protein
MGPPSYMGSVVERNVMRRMTVLCCTLSVQNTSTLKKDDITSPQNVMLLLVIKTSNKFRRIPAVYHSYRNRLV